MNLVLRNILFAIILMPSLAQAAFAPTAPRPDFSIAAVVGEEAISSYDVENRTRFVITTTKLSNTPDLLARIRPQVLRSLIDEKLQLQEAAKNNITTEDQDIAQAVAAIEQQRGMQQGAIFRMLDQNGVPRETFLSQIRAQLSWNRLINRKVRPQIRISDEEIDRARQKSLVPAVRREYEIAVLNLPVENKNRDAEVRRAAEKLVGEVRTGASFEEVSRQFSSASGGKIATFWIRPEQMDPVIAGALATAQAGTVTPPIRTSEGYTVVKVYNTRALSDTPVRETEVNLKEILLKLKPDAPAREADVLLAIGEEVANHPGTCEEKGIASIKDVADFDIQVDFRRANLSALPPAIKIIAENLKVGEISSPFATNEGIRLYMLCEKKEAGPPEPDRDRLYNALLQQRLELEAQKYMRNLRRETFVEIR